MRVAETMRNHRAFYAHHSRPYADPITNTVRETDVVGTWVGPPPRWVYVYLIAECKSAPKPWVIFDEGVDSMTDDAQLRLDMAVAAEAPTNGHLAARVAKGNGIHKTVLAPSRIGTSVTAITGQKPDANAVNSAWSGVQAAVSAARGFQSDLDVGHVTGGESQLYVGVLTFPIVVTTGGLYRSWLVGDRLEVEAIDRGEVTVRPTPTTSLLRCFIVTEAGLPDLCKRAKETADFLAMELLGSRHPRR